MGQTHWDSKSNNIPFISLSEAEVIALVNKALSGNAARTSTYKFAFFKAILDNVFNVDLDSMFLNYDSIAVRFTEIYWNLVLKFHLKQMIAVTSGKITAVEHELYDFCDRYNFNYSFALICFIEMIELIIGVTTKSTDNIFHHLCFYLFGNF